MFFCPRCKFPQFTQKKHNWHSQHQLRRSKCFSILSQVFLLDLHPFRHYLPHPPSRRRCSLSRFHSERRRQDWRGHLHRWSCLPSRHSTLFRWIVHRLRYQGFQVTGPISPYQAHSHLPLFPFPFDYLHLDSMWLPNCWAQWRILQCYLSRRRSLHRSWILVRAPEACHIYSNNSLTVLSMMCIAVLLLNAGHPGYAFKETPEFTKEMDQMDQDDTTVFGD